MSLARPPRVIGSMRGADPGPTLIALGGIHGNEPAGVLALARVVAELERLDLPLRGDFVALSGNRSALARGERYLGRDLNRAWTEERLARLREGRGGAEPEEIEQRELLEALDRALASARGPSYFLDLHTTSADGYPFALVGDAPPERAFAGHFPLPGILGLVRHLEGVLLDYMRERGAIALGVEGGQSQRPESVDHHEAVLWIALVAAGLVEAPDAPRLEERRLLLERARDGLPRLLEVLGRYAIVPEDRFRMEPGFTNIHPVRKGDLLARDRHGEVRAPATGYLFLPLYQGLGDEGFFFGRSLAG